MTPRKPLALFSSLTMATALLMGCATQSRIVRSQQRMARIKIGSTSGTGTVVKDGRSVGETPKAVAIPYEERVRKVTPGSHRTGKWLVITALVSLAASVGLAALAYKAHESGFGGDALPTASLASAGLLSTYGSIGVVYGGILWAVSTPEIDVLETVPASLDLALRFPRDKSEYQLHLKRKGSVLPRYDLIPSATLDRSTGTWQIPTLPPSVKIEAKTKSFKSASAN